MPKPNNELTANDCGEMACNQAIRFVLDHLPITDYTEPARAVLKCILEQRGCEDLDPAGDGSLTDFMDIVIFG